MSTASGPQAFVTGGSGFVGGALCLELVRQGWTVTALLRSPDKSRRLAEQGVTLVQGDILDPASIARALPQGVDAVFHVAGDTSLWAKHDAMQTRINVDGTCNLVEAAKAAGAKRFVLTSTISAYGLQPGTITEATPSVAPQSFINYERSKFASEDLVRREAARGFDAVILQPGAIIGPGDASNWGRMFGLVKAGMLPFLPAGTLPFNHVDQIVLAHIAAAERGRAGESYLLGGHDMKLADMVAGICQRVGRRKPGFTMPPALMGLMGRLVGALTPASASVPLMSRELAAMMSSETRSDSSKAMRELGLKPTSLDACLDDAHRWLVAEGLV